MVGAGQGSKGEGRFCSLFSYPSWTRSSPLPVTFPPPFFPPCLGRLHRTAGREVHEEDFPLNHKLSLSFSSLSLSLSLCTCMCVYAKMGAGDLGWGAV